MSPYSYKSAPEGAVVHPPASQVQHPRPLLSSLLSNREENKHKPKAAAHSDVRDFPPALLQGRGLCPSLCFPPLVSPGQPTAQQAEQMGKQK